MLRRILRAGFGALLLLCIDVGSAAAQLPSIPVPRPRLGPYFYKQPGDRPSVPIDMGDVSACQGPNVRTFYDVVPPSPDGRYQVNADGQMWYATPCNDKVKAALDYAWQNRMVDCRLQVLIGDRGSVILGVSACQAPGPQPLPSGESFNSGNGAQQVAQRYAPAVYLSPGESFLPSSIDYYANYSHLWCNGQVVREDMNQLQFGDLPDRTASGCFLAPKGGVDSPYDRPDWVHGQDPTTGQVPIYVFIYTDARDPASQFNFLATYMMFFPYNYGKDACFTFSFNDNCWDHRVSVGNHVGDWEMITIRFRDGLPVSVHVGSHDNEQPKTATTYFYPAWKDPSAPDKPALSWMGQHPIVYSANGSHGIYGWADKHNYKSVPSGDELNDYTGQGPLWRTWDKIEWSTWTTPRNDLLLNSFAGRWGTEHMGKNACELAGMKGWCLSIPQDEFQLNDGPNKPDMARDRPFMFQ